MTYSFLPVNVIIINGARKNVNAMLLTKFNTMLIGATLSLCAYNANQLQLLLRGGQLHIVLICHIGPIGGEGSLNPV